MNDAVADVIAERESLDRGFPGGVLLSSVFHGVVIGGALLAAWLGAAPPRLNLPDGMVVAVPPGGGGPVEVAAGVPTPVKSQPPEPVPAVEPPRIEPPRIVKPPKEEPPKKALPDPDPRKAAKKPTPAPPRQAAAPSSERPRPGPVGSSGTTRTTNSQGGVGIIAPVGPGAPGGMDPNGDWYLAGVQRKIWAVWMQQMKVGFVQPVRLSFTILADGSLEESSVQIVQASGNTLIDMAAKRAVYSGAPFAPLPKHYGTNRFTIQALFEPVP